MRCSQCAQSDLKSQDADCERQVAVKCHDPDAVCFTRQIILSEGKTAVEKLCASWQAVKEEFPTAALDACGEASDGRVRFCTCTTNECNSMAISLQGIPLRCAACLETGITDPTADCSTSAPAVCASHEKYCLTRQTQNEGVTFTMEKRCISESMVASVTKSESATVQLGCAIADGGMINYCLCKEDLCNEGSLLAQAQVSGIRKTEPASKPEPPQPPVEELPKIDLPKIETPTHVFLDNDETAKLETVRVPETKLSDEERDLIERQKQWDQEDLAASASQLGLLGSLIVFLFGGLLF
ncbi:unnamed protein product [Haemonchus placei]|uniref:DUF753 domain-containing protein n=1 Tax=Haemonchus placei TaxID=6290 RepID=A0A0N4X0Y2_HAEPC|nr:unnamed protein product [Haemonchus placei]